MVNTVDDWYSGEQEQGMPAGAMGQASNQK